MLPQLDVSTYPAQIFWILVSFGGLFLVMRWFVVPRFESVLNARSESLSAMHAEIVHLHQEAESLDRQNAFEWDAAQTRLKAECSETLFTMQEVFENARRALEISYESRLNDALATLNAEAQVCMAALETHVPTVCGAFEKREVCA